MAKKVVLGSTKRFGARYGAKNRAKVAAIEKQHRGKHKCPFCNYVQVRRVSSGIWTCEKCKETFTGKAYTFENKKRRSADLLRKPKAEKIEEDFDDYEEELEETEEVETKEEKKEDSDVPPELEGSQEPAEDEEVTA